MSAYAQVTTTYTLSTMPSRTPRFPNGLVLFEAFGKASLDLSSGTVEDGSNS